MNDSTVTMVSPQHVLRQQAYILFYSRVQPVVPESKSSRIEIAENGKNDKKIIIENTGVLTKSSNDGTNNYDYEINIDNKSNNSSYIDDLGVSLTLEEVALRNKLHEQSLTEKKSSGSSSEKKNKKEKGINEENKEEEEEEEEDDDDDNMYNDFINMQEDKIVDIDEEKETRLIKIKSWDVRPYR